MGPARKKLVLLMIISCVPTPVIAGEEDPTQEKRLSSEESAEPKRDPTRVIYAPTAMGREKGEWGLTIYDLALADVEYGLAENLEAGLEVAAPGVFVGFALRAKVWGRVASFMALAVSTHAAFVFPLLESRGQAWTVLGVKPILTFGNLDSYLNLGVNLFLTDMPLDAKAVSAPTSQASWTSQHENRQSEGKLAVYSVPTAGFVVRLGRIVSVLGQVDVPFPRPVDAMGELVLSYGIRIHGDHLVLDAAFVLPLESEDAERALRYCPIGLPLIAISKSRPKKQD